MTTQNTSHGKPDGMGFGSVLFFIFLILKLTGNIDWSWWWVTAPLWVPAALALFLLAVAGAMIAYADHRDSKRRRAARARLQGGRRVR